MMKSIILFFILSAAFFLSGQVVKAQTSSSCVCKGTAVIKLLAGENANYLTLSCSQLSGKLDTEVTRACNLSSFAYFSKLEDCNSNFAQKQLIDTVDKLSSKTEYVHSFSMTCAWETPGGAQSESGAPPGTSPEELKNTALSLNPAGIGAPTDLINRAIRGLMAFIGSITLVLYIYAGILWMTASGASERVDKAKKIIVWTTLGAVMMLASYMLASFLFSAIPK